MKNRTQSGKYPWISGYLNQAFLTLCFCISVHDLGWSQKVSCGTAPTSAERQQYFEQLKLMQERPLQRDYEDITLRLIMYRLRFDDGSGARSDSEFAELVNDINEIYSLEDICFSLMRIENIDNSELANADWNNDADSLKSVINSQYPSFSDAVTLYILPPHLFEGAWSGSAYGIPSTAAIVRSTSVYWNAGLYCHELGHCLGLFHTHETNDGSNIELVTRNLAESCFNDQGHWHDCNIGGDGMCDTEADFGLDGFVDPVTCEYTYDSVDCQGNTYIPDPRNVMSYAPFQCIFLFSFSQHSKMHLTLDIGIIFDNKQAHNDYTLHSQNWTSDHSNYLAKNSITVAGDGNFSATGSAQVMHEAENFVDLKPGFHAAPANSQGFYLARAKDLCNNSTSNDYAINE